MRKPQSRPYQKYKSERLGTLVDYDKAYGNQCVDLIKDYRDTCLGEGRQGRSGDARDIWTNKYNYFDGSWERIEGLNDVMQGDIICSVLLGKQPSGEKLGHIGIVDSIDETYVYVLEQNGKDKSSISVGAYKHGVYAGVWRNKKISENFGSEFVSVKTLILNYTNIIKSCEVVLDLSTVDATCKVAEEAIIYWTEANKNAMEYKDTIRWVK